MVFATAARADAAWRERAGGADRLAHWLGERGDVDSIRTDGELALFMHDGDRSSEAALLREIVNGGFDVVEFGHGK